MNTLTAVGSTRAPATFDGSPVHNVDERPALARALEDSVDVSRDVLGHLWTRQVLVRDREDAQLAADERSRILRVAEDPFVVRERDPASSIGISDPARVGNSFVLASFDATDYIGESRGTMDEDGLTE
jgi:hypothetical protein